MGSGALVQRTPGCLPARAGMLVSASANPATGKSRAVANAPRPDRSLVLDRRRQQVEARRPEGDAEEYEQRDPRQMRPPACLIRQQADQQQPAYRQQHEVRGHGRRLVIAASGEPTTSSLPRPLRILAYALARNCNRIVPEKKIASIALTSADTPFETRQGRPESCRRPRRTAAMFQPASTRAASSRDRQGRGWRGGIEEFPSGLPMERPVHFAGSRFDGSFGSP